MTSTVQHLYLHVPYCSGTCTYCVLYSQHYQAARASRYVDMVLHEMDLGIAGGLRLEPETVFIGGGTPSVLDEALFERLMLGLRARLAPGRLTEWTLEAQPGTFTAAKLDVMRAVGVTRVSMGVQALNDATLVRVARRHTVADVDASLDMLHGGGFTNTGIDLIACLPGVTHEEWMGTVQRAAGMPLQHLSVYALTIEPDSILAETVKRGEFTPADDETQVAELDAAETGLGAAGFTRYEVSNYAKAGRECLHNLAYWRGRDYVGFGPAASSRVGRERWTNVANTAAYTRALESGAAPPRETDTLSPRADCAERLMFGLRLLEGVVVAPFAQGDADLDAHWQSTLRRLQTHGLTHANGPRWSLTRDGRLYADSIAEELLLDDA